MSDEGLPTTERSPESQKGRGVTWFSSEPDRPLGGPATSFFRGTSFFGRRDSNSTWGGASERHNFWREEQRSKTTFLREQLRKRRTQRVHGSTVELASVELGADVSEQAHSCLRQLFPCCDVDISQLPCGRSRSIQVLCGNEAEWASQESGDRRGAVDSSKGVHAGVMFDLPTLEEARWEKVQRLERVNGDGDTSPVGSVDMDRRASVGSSVGRRGSKESAAGRRSSKVSSDMSVSVDRRGSNDSSSSPVSRRGSKTSPRRSSPRKVSSVGRRISVESKASSKGRRSSGASSTPRIRFMGVQFDGMDDVNTQAELEHREAAFSHLRLSAVTRREEGRRVYGMLLSVNKEEVPGTQTQVRSLLHNLEKVNHVNAVSLLQACESERHLHLVFEDCPGAGLLNERMSSQQLLSGQEMATLLHELSAVLCSCSRLQLAQLDFSVWDIMSKNSDSLFPVKLFGIGLAGVLVPAGRSSELRRSFYYRSPEVSRMMEHESANLYARLPARERRVADVWSLAALAFHTHAGRPPYGGATEAAVRENQLRAKALMVGAALGDLPPEAIGLLEQCLQAQPSARPTAKKILSHPWIMTSARRGHTGAVNGILDRLVSFAKQQNIMRALGKLFLQAMRPEKEHNMQAMFRAIDVAGDGSLECHEVIAVVAHRRDEVKALFKSLAKDGQISLEDFVLANMFSEEILTERLLLETFNTIDLDSNGQISAAELYQAMHSKHPEVTPVEVSRFVMEADMDWSAQISFDEFCQRVPGASLRKDTNAPRRKALMENLTLCRRGSMTLQTRLSLWLAEVRSCHRRLLKIEGENKTFEKAGSDKVCSKCIKLLGEAKKLMANPPAAKLPPDAELVLGKRRLLNPPSRENAYGVFALDSFVHHCNKQWSRQFAQLQRETSEAAQEDHESIRRVTLDELISQGLCLFNDVLAWVESYKQEQMQSLEASMEWEATCPSFPWSRRCIASTEGVSKETQEELQARLMELTSAVDEEAMVAKKSFKKATLKSVSQRLKLTAMKSIGWASSTRANSMTSSTKATEGARAE